MDEKLRRYYLESKVSNASPGQRLIMIYDCLIKNAEKADAAITSPENPHDLTPAADAVTGCIKAITELSATLQFNFDPSLCSTLSGLYRFFAREFSEALNRRDPRKIRAILPLIRDLRDTWVEADRRAGQLQAAAA
jgi:flagellar secretion chaperone FliS